MSHDAQLLREFAERRSEAAFAELVRRNLGLVYHGARRQLGDDVHLAEDVTQSVFLALAAKAAALARHPNVAGWLYCTTAFKVAETVRSERRKRVREDRAAAMQEQVMPAEPATDWTRIKPVLDEAVLSLGDRDREAILLRFFSGLPFAAIGAQLSLSERAAQMRVQRALAKLRERLARRGIESTAAALGLALDDAMAAAHPPGLASSVTRAVMHAPVPAAIGVAHTTTAIKLAAVIAGAAAAVTGSLALHSVVRWRQAKAALARAESEATQMEGRLHDDHQRNVARVRAAKQAAVAAAAAASQRQSNLAEQERARAGGQFLRAHPEVRAAFLRQIEGEHRAEFDAFLRHRNLSPAQIDRFYALTARLESWDDLSHHMEFNFEGEPLAKGEFSAGMNDILGPGGYAAYRAYDGNYTRMRNVRELVQEVEGGSYCDDAPLTGTQRQRLTDLMVNAQPAPVGAGGQYVIPWDALVAAAPAVLQGGALEVLESQHDQVVYNREFAKALEAEVYGGTPPPGVTFITR